MVDLENAKSLCAVAVVVAAGAAAALVTLAGEVLPSVVAVVGGRQHGYSRTFYGAIFARIHCASGFGPALCARS